MKKSENRIKSERVSLLRKSYETLLNEERRRKDRNVQILGSLDRMCMSSAVALRSPMMRNDYYRYNITSASFMSDDVRKQKFNETYQPLIPAVTNEFNEERILRDLSKKYIIIPKLRQPYASYQPEIDKNVQVNAETEDWKRKYEILTQLKQGSSLSSGFMEAERDVLSNDDGSKNYNETPDAIPESNYSIVTKGKSDERNAFYESKQNFTNENKKETVLDEKLQMEEHNKYTSLNQNDPENIKLNKDLSEVIYANVINNKADSTASANNEIDSETLEIPKLNQIAEVEAKLDKVDLQQPIIENAQENTKIINENIVNTLNTQQHELTTGDLQFNNDIQLTENQNYDTQAYEDPQVEAQPSEYQNYEGQQNDVSEYSEQKHMAGYQSNEQASYDYNQSEYENYPHQNESQNYDNQPLVNEAQTTEKLNFELHATEQQDYNSQQQGLEYQSNNDLNQNDYENYINPIEYPQETNENSEYIDNNMVQEQIDEFMEENDKMFYSDEQPYEYEQPIQDMSYNNEQVHPEIHQEQFNVDNEAMQPYDQSYEQQYSGLEYSPKKGTTNEINEQVFTEPQPIGEYAIYENKTQPAFDDIKQELDNEEGLTSNELPIVEDKKHQQIQP